MDHHIPMSSAVHMVPGPKRCNVSSLPMHDPCPRGPRPHRICDHVTRVIVLALKNQFPWAKLTVSNQANAVYIRFLAARLDRVELDERMV